MTQAPGDARVVIGLDVGTTAAKVSAFALGGSWRASADNEIPRRRPPGAGGWG